MALGPVRTVSSVPVAANFASGDGTPIVVNDTPGSETAYILNASGSVAALGGSAGAAAFTQVVATGASTVRASVTTSLRVSASTNITINLNATANAITLSAASGAGEAFPVGSIFMAAVTTDPATLLGYGTWTYMGEGQVLFGMASGTPAFNTVLASGGFLAVPSTGSVSQPTFTGDLYTPSGSNAVVQFQPSGSNAISLTRDAVAGTNAISLTRSEVSGSNAISLSREAVAGTNAVSLFRDAAAGTNAASAVTGTVSIAWPTGVPTFAGTTATVSVSVNWPAGNVSVISSAHRHELPIIHSKGALTVLFLPTATYGVGASRVPDVRNTATASGAGAGWISDVTNSGVVMMSNTVTAFATTTWPASVPQAVQSVGFLPAGIISWPATAPSASEGLTAAAQIFTGVTGSVSGQVFTGLTVSVSGQVFTGLTASVSGQIFTGTTASVSGQVFTGVTGTVSGQVFTGVAKAATGTVSKPVFTGASASVVPPYVTVCMWRRVA